MLFDAQRLLSFSFEDRNLYWLQQMLRIAIALEWATIPPYLCAFWSIDEDDDPGYVKNQLGRIALEEMGHLGLACNLLCAFHQNSGYPDFHPLPVLNDPLTAPEYPGSLPGGVHPGLSLSLSKLTKDKVGTEFMQLEFPHPEAVSSYLGNHYTTIGEFYRAIVEVVAHNNFPMNREYQRASPNVHVKILENVDDALWALDIISSEGEGAHGSPFVTNGLAHYYQFAEFFWGRHIKPCDGGGWGFCGDAIEWPSSILNMDEVPQGGYSTSDAFAFDRQYTKMLDLLTWAWHQTDPAVGDDLLQQAIHIMKTDAAYGLRPLAQRLMRTPRGTGLGNYGPCFRIVR